MYRITRALRQELYAKRCNGYWLAGFRKIELNECQISSSDTRKRISGMGRVRSDSRVAKVYDNYKYIYGQIFHGRNVWYCVSYYPSNVAHIWLRFLDVVLPVIREFNFIVLKWKYVIREIGSVCSDGWKIIRRNFNIKTNADLYYLRMHFN